MKKFFALAFATAALAAAFAPVAHAQPPWEQTDHGVCICDPPLAVS